MCICNEEKIEKSFAHDGYGYNSPIERKNTKKKNDSYV